MLKAIFLTTLILLPAIAAAVPAGRTAQFASPQEVARVDPGKTLRLIKRIKDAGGRHVAS